MSQQIINIGSDYNDPTADNLRVAFGKVNDNDTELYSQVASLPKKKHLVFLGDSTTASYQLGPEACWPAFFAGRVSIPTTASNYYNVAIAGQPVYDMVAQYDTQTAPYILPGSTLLPIWGGINDINLGQTAAQIYANLKTLWLRSRNLGATTVAMTLYPSVVNNTVRLALNALIVSDQTLYDYLVDLSAVNIPTYDGSHETVEGAMQVAQLVADVVAPDSSTNAGMSVDITGNRFHIPFKPMFSFGSTNPTYTTMFIDDDGAFLIFQNPQTNRQFAFNRNVLLGFTLIVNGVTTLSGGLSGNTTGVAVSSGLVGQVIRSILPVGSAVTVPATGNVNVTSISLPAGNWMVSGNLNFNTSGATVTDPWVGAITSTSATIPTDGSQCCSAAQITSATTANTVTLPPKQFLVPVGPNLTVYMVASAPHGVGSIGGWGQLMAQRIT